MSDLSYLPIRAKLSAAHLRTIFQEAERRLGLHFNQLSPLLWRTFDPRLLGVRRYFVPGSTPIKDFLDPLDNMAEYVFAKFASGGYLPTSADNRFFRAYDMTPFDSAESACSLLVKPSGSTDPRPITSSLGPTALVDSAVFTGALTNSMFPLRAGTTGWAPEEYIKSWYFSPKAHRKNFAYGPEYSGATYNAYLCSNGSVIGDDVPPVDEQAGPEHVSAFNPAEWIIGAVGGTWTFPTYETKEREHRIHNMDSQVLAVSFPNSAVWSIPAGGCMTVRRNTLTEFVKNTWADSTHSSYFFRFQENDPRVLHVSFIAGSPPLVAGSALDQGGSNLIDTLLLNYVMYYLDGGYLGPLNAGVYDADKAQDISDVYNNPAYTTHGKAREITVPVGGFYGTLSDTTPVGDLLVHKGKLMFISTNTQRSIHSQSFSATPFDTFNLFKMEDGRVALEVQDIHMFSASVSVPEFGPSYNWTSSANVNGTGSIFFTSSVFNPFQTVLCTYTSRDPDNFHIDNFKGFADLPALLARNSMSLVDASADTLIPGTYYISSSRDIQIVQNSTNFCTYISPGNIAIDPHGTTPKVLVNRIDCFTALGTWLPYVSAITQTNEKIDWVVSSDGAAAGWTNPVTTSVQCQNLWRAYYTGSLPSISNMTMSLFDPVSKVLNLIRNFGANDGNQCTINADLKMTPYGVQIVLDYTIPIDWPLINGSYQDIAGDGQPLFWIPQNYNSGSGGSWYGHRCQRLGFYAGNLVDSGDGWTSPGNWRGEQCVPRIKRAYGETRTLTSDPAELPYAISGNFSLYLNPYDTIENARLRTYGDTDNNNGLFLNYSNGSNDWRKTLVGSPPTHFMNDMAYVGHFDTSANKLACLQAWKSKGTASINGGIIDFRSGTARETSYYTNNKATLLDGSLTDDDRAVIPQLLPHAVEQINIAISAVNHSKGTLLPAGGYVPDTYITITQMFPVNSIGRGFTQFNGQWAIDEKINIRPRDCAVLWIGGDGSETVAPEWLDLSSSAELGFFGVTAKTVADGAFADTKFQAVIAHGATTKWLTNDVTGAGLNISDYPFSDPSNGSQSLWVEPGNLWGNLYPILIPISQIRWLTFDDMNTIALAKTGRKFPYQDLVVPLKFDYIQTPGFSVVGSDNSGLFGGGQYTYPCSYMGWYVDPNGTWVASGTPLDSFVVEPTTGSNLGYALRADTTAVKPLLLLFDPGIGGNQCTLVQMDAGRLPEAWSTKLGNYIPSAIADFPFCVPDKSILNHQRNFGNNSYLYRHYGPDAGALRGHALITKRNFVDYDRTHISSVNNYFEFLHFSDYIDNSSWDSIPKTVSSGVSGPPRKIDFTSDETLIFASDIPYGYVQILQTYHDWSLD